MPRNGLLSSAFYQMSAGTTPSVPIPDSMHIDPNGNPLLNAAKRVNALGAGIGTGVLGTMNGVADLVHLPHATLTARAAELAQQNRENPGLSATGQTTETMAEFLSGDELLKGLSMGDKFLKFSKIASALESSPLAMRAFEIGANAIRQGTVQGISTGVKTGDATQAAVQGGAGALATGAVETALHVPSIYRGYFSSKVVQDGLQNSVRNILAKTADAAGVDTAVTDTPSLRDAANALGANLKAKAGAMYDSLDTVTGGRIQRFREQLEAVQDEIANSIEGADAPRGARPTESFEQTFGVHPDDTPELARRKAAIVAARDVAMQKLKDAGLDPGLLDKADATFKQGSALTDLSNQIRASVNGLRPELANAASNTPETVNTGKLFPRLNKLADRGRLAQAIGQENADALLQHVDEAHLAEQRVAARVKTFGNGIKTAIGAGSLGAGIEAVRHAFGGQ